MKKLISIFTVVAMFSVFTACNSDNATNKAAKEENKDKFAGTDEKKDANFAVKVASGGMMEVELGKVAVTNGASDQVKKFGQDMIADHSKANDEFKTLAGSKNISLPSEPNTDMQKKINDLKQKTGNDFDKAYIDLMVDDHKDDIDEFQKEADKGNDAEIKTWAAGKVPTLQHHLKMAQDIQDALKNHK